MAKGNLGAKRLAMGTSATATTASEPSQPRQQHGGGEVTDSHVALLDHVLEHRQLVEELRRHPIAVLGLDRQNAAEHEQEGVEPHFAVTPEEDDARNEDGEETPAQVRGGPQRRALVPAERQIEVVVAAGDVRRHEGRSEVTADL
jgi:hypothetical protein